MSVKIKAVIKKSPCGRKNIAAGDILLSVNGHEITDVLDYSFYIDAENPVLATQTIDGRKKLTKIKKSSYEDSGLKFETYLMDKQQHCKNKCVFCFIDQLPKGLRDSLYFKDDDSRLSFLFGNYITLTNLTEREVQRIVDMHISPVNISVHTMNPELRVRIMKNQNAGESLSYIEFFAKNNIKMNTQLVLCPGINDGTELERSLSELSRFFPQVQSIAAVPVGLTRHRDGLFKLRGYTKDEARKVIEIIERFNVDFSEKNGETIAYAADEFFLKAELPLPCSEYYNDYPQLENGVGLCTLLKTQFAQALENERARKVKRKVSIATGAAAFELISVLAKNAQKKFEGLDISVYKIENRLLGESVTVAGLISGQDFFEQLSEKNLGDKLLIPAASLRREGDMFIDSMTLEELSERLNVKLTPVQNDGASLLCAILGN